MLPHISKKEEHMVVSSAGRDDNLWTGTHLAMPRKFPWRVERRARHGPQSDHQIVEAASSRKRAFRSARGG